MVQLPDGYRLIELEETASTNLDALEAARRGEPGNLWITAKRQTAGKGSRGREWVSVPGNLYASLLLKDPAEPRNLPELTFVASLAVRNALAALAAEQRVTRDFSLKWPNDVLCGGRKISGILLENHEVAGWGRAIVVGIGVNVASHPAETLHKAGDLASEGVVTEPLQTLERIAAEFDNCLARWAGGSGFLSIREEWLEQASGIGERIFVRLPNRQLSGVFEDLDEDGMLCLLLDDGSTVRLSVADVFLMSKA